MRVSSTKNLKPMSLKIDYEIKNENNKESILLLFMFSRKKKMLLSAPSLTLYL